MVDPERNAALSIGLARIADIDLLNSLVMTQADRIREFVRDHYITPARAEGRAEITVRAGDIHRSMGLSNAMPAVCSAIGSNKFNEFARVSLHHRTGPANGANVYFTFDLSPRPTSDRRIVPRREPVLRAKSTPTESDLDLSDAIVLVSCVKSKLPHSAPARELYTSAWFQKARRIVEASGSSWFVLSSLYGLVAPNTKIAPYEYTLNTVGVAERRAWATKVLDKLLPETAGQRRVVMFAGHRYREFLIEPLRRHGITVVVPMAHLTRGEQLAWLSEHE